MVVSGQLHASAALFLAEDFPYPLRKRPGGLHARDKTLIYRGPNHIPSLHGLYEMRAILSTSELNSSTVDNVDVVHPVAL
jgi:hypothetical protein